MTRHYRSLLLAMTLIMTLALASASRAQTNSAPDSLAERPHWPLGFKLADEVAPTNAPAKPSTKADILVWVPEGAKRIRGAFLIPNNSDSKEVSQHSPIRAVLAKHEIGIVFMRQYDTGIEHVAGPGTPQRMQALMDWLARQTGIAEFRHAPWIVVGKSSRGEFPYRACWQFPDRVIASITYHGETPPWPLRPFAKLDGQSILHVNANGETEWGGTWYNHVRPALLNYRAQTGWLPHQIVARGVGHGDYADASGSAGWGKKFPGKIHCLDTWDYLALFLDKALGLRLPKDQYPTDGPLKLKQVDPSTGYLIDPFAVEAMFEVPRLPLHKTETGYTLGGDQEPTVNGYAIIPPTKGLTPPEGVPIVKADPSLQGFKDWLVVDTLKFAMDADPMLALGEIEQLKPKPGDTVTIDGKTGTFQRITPGRVAPEGGLSLNGLPINKTLLAYTILEVTEKTAFKLNAPFTAATRQQVVLNGVPVRHKQILQLDPGLYPLLVVIRMTVKWGRIGPWLEIAPETELTTAKQQQAEYEASRAEQTRLLKEGLLKPELMIRKFSDVPETDRARMFWVADKEQADAWLKFHTLHKQQP